MKIFILNLVLLALIAPLNVLAQDQALDEAEIINIENLYKDVSTKSNINKGVNSKTEVIKNETLPNDSGVETSKSVMNIQVENISDLNKLSPFSDISVIQKKYLAKTNRFQFYGALGMTTNSPWFLNVGAKLNLGYNFSENLGLELSTIFLTSSERDAAKDLRTNNSLQPEKFVLTKSNITADIIWSPIYGKVTTLENKIIPFDMYFSFGGGISSTTAQEKNVATLHVGTGQIFAITKNAAFRWDYSWSGYQATPVQDVGSTAVPTKTTYNDLIFTAGFSFFFPEANAR